MRTGEMPFPLTSVITKNISRIWLTGRKPSSLDQRWKPWTASLSAGPAVIMSPGRQAGSWYEMLSGTPSREEWEKAMGHSVAIVPEAKKGQFTLDNSCLEMKDSSLIMKIQYKIMENIIAKSFGGKKDYSDPAFKMVMVCAVDCPLRAVVINAGGTMSDSLAQGLLEMANGHYIRGIKAMLKK